MNNLNAINFTNYKTDERPVFTDVHTIEEANDIGRDIDITHYNLSILRKLDNDIEYPTSTILDDYMDELLLMSIPYEMSDDEFRRYNMRPDLFCYDKYGSLDMDFIILALNNINKDIEFTRKTIRYIDPEDMDEIISNITGSEEEYIESNRLNYEDVNSF